jgi:hypothetical protein
MEPSIEAGHLDNTSCPYAGTLASEPQEPTPHSVESAARESRQRTEEMYRHMKKYKNNKKAKEVSYRQNVKKNKNTSSCFYYKISEGRKPTAVYLTIPLALRIKILLTHHVL